MPLVMLKAKVMEDENIKGDSLKSYIISEIDRGNPVILFHSNGADNNCEGHAVTVLGYEIKNGKMNVIYNAPGFEWNNIQITEEIDQMKSRLPDSNLNLYGAYSIRENIKKEENLWRKYLK